MKNLDFEIPYTKLLSKVNIASYKNIVGYLPLETV